MIFLNNIEEIEKSQQELYKYYKQQSDNYSKLTYELEKVARKIVSARKAILSHTENINNLYHSACHELNTFLNLPEETDGITKEYLQMEFMGE